MFPDDVAAANCSFQRFQLGSARGACSVVIGMRDGSLMAADAAIPQAMLQPFPAQLMTAYPVSRRVINPENDDADLIASSAA